jgi:formamidopyrimidine-DNA glycosylase
MPELPEVETIARYLRQGREDSPPLPGQQVSGVQLLWDRTLAYPTPQEFLSRIHGQTVQDIGRRGKFLRIPLSQDTLLVHLRMSGDIRVEAARKPADVQLLNSHDRLVLEFSSGLRMVFNDTRKFGRVWLLEDPEAVLGALGPEPLDGALTAMDFYSMLHSRRRQLKPLLLDQTFLAGLGNIYTDEGLHSARLHPLALSDRLSLEQAERLLSSIRKVLREGIRRQGASIDWVYRGGDFQNYFRVYQRTGQPCPQCGTAIMRLLVGQRGTHICPDCQPLDR